MKEKRVVFMGTPEFAVPVLKELIKKTNVVLVVCQPDSFYGRKKALTKCSTKILAESYGIPVFQPEKVRNDFKTITDMKPDIIITCAYGQILPEELLNYPEYKTINIHGSILPKLRGGAPIRRAIMEGFKETGITIMRTDKGMDSGDIIISKSIVIDDADNNETLSNKLSILGADLLLETLPTIFNKTCNYIKQDEKEVTFAKIIKSEDEYINFNKSTKEVYNCIRALAPAPGGYAFLNNERIKIYEAKIGNKSCGLNGEIIELYEDGLGVSTNDGEIVITKLQFPGKRIMTVKEYLNGVNKEKILGNIFK